MEPELPPPPKAAFELVRQLWQDDPPDDERRQDPRFPATGVLRVQPLDEALRPRGEPFLAVLRDVSVRGISFVHTRAVPHGYVQLDIHKAAVRTPRLLVTIVWCKPVRTLYLVAGRILTRDVKTQDCDANPSESPQA